MPRLFLFRMPQPIPSLKFEHKFWSCGLVHVAGVDEVGRGAWAGPVLAGAVILPPVARRSMLHDLALVRDSKLLSPAQREKLIEPICTVALAVATGLATRAEIDQFNILGATRLAMQRAIAALALTPHALLIDALVLEAMAVPQNAIIHGDQLSLSIACASVVAKVTRDHLMVEMDALYPGYAFGRHKGYGTEEHRAALERLGPCGEHRASFAPIRERLNHEPPAT